MTSKFARLLLATAFLISLTALAQDSGSPAALPAAPSAAAAAPSSGAAASVPTNATGTKVGTINLNEAIAATNEGQRDLEALNKHFEPKQTQLKGMNDEIDGLKKQLNTQSATLNDETRGTLVKQIEQKQKLLDRAMQDARDDAQNQQSELAQRILQKMGPLVLKYAADNGFGLILDTSNLWPQGPVVWYGPAVDITRPVIDAYNAQSNVPAPANKPSASRPTAPKSGSVTPTGTKPATTTPAAPKPQPNQPPK